MDVIRLELPYPPALNSLYRSAGKRWYISDKARKYKETVYISVRHQNAPNFASTLLSMKIYIYPPDKRKRDIDGILKATLDSLQKAAVYDDDCQIKKLYCEMLSPIHLGKLLIEIAPLP